MVLTLSGACTTQWLNCCKPHLALAYNCCPAVLDTCTYLIVAESDALLTWHRTTGDFGYNLCSKMRCGWILVFKQRLQVKYSWSSCKIGISYCEVAVLLYWRGLWCYCGYGAAWSCFVVDIVVVVTIAVVDVNAVASRQSLFAILCNMKFYVVVEAELRECALALR